MFTLAHLFQNMAHGELSNIAIGDATLGSISPADYSNMVSHVQLGLTALHQRFLLRTDQVVIQQNSSTLKYWLKSDYAQSNTSSIQPVKYIIDSAADPFIENVLKIEQVFDELGAEFTINNSAADVPIYTPSYNCLAITPTVANPAWFVLYRANYPEIPIGVDFDPTSVVLDIPSWLIEPLQAYVTARIMTGRSHSIFEGVAEGDKYMARYEQLCMMIEHQNLDADDNDTYSHLEANGWV
jgi:hypothetical protein